MPKLTEILAELETILQEENRPVATAPELSERLDQSRRKTLDDLRLLERNGDVKSHQVGAKARVWWPSERRDTRDTPSPEQTGDTTDTSNEPTTEQRQANNDRPKREASREVSNLIDDLLEDWKPGTSLEDRQKRKQIGRQALVWLHNQGNPAQKAEFIDALYEDTHLENQAEKTWWEYVIKPPLKRAREADIVEYTPGSSVYEWIGENDSGLTGVHDIGE